MRLQAGALPGLTSAYGDISNADINRIGAGVNLLNTEQQFGQQDFSNLLAANQSSRAGGQSSQDILNAQFGRFNTATGTDQAALDASRQYGLQRDQLGGALGQQDFTNLLAANRASEDIAGAQLGRFTSAYDRDRAATGQDRQYGLDLSQANQQTASDLYDLNTQEGAWWADQANQAFQQQAQGFGLNQGARMDQNAIFNQQIGNRLNANQQLGAQSGQDLQTMLATLNYQPQLLMDLAAAFGGRDTVRSNQTIGMIQAASGGGLGPAAVAAFAG